jgi:putative transposase
MATQHDKQFKLDAIQYYQDHKDLGVRGCAENLGIGYSTLTKWLKDFRESFHSIIKSEWLNRFKIRDYKQAYRVIFEYLEAFYNTKRIHSHCNYMSPNEFERVYERTHTEAELLAG